MPNVSKSDQGPMILTGQLHAILQDASVCYAALKTLQSVLVRSQKRIKNEEVLSPQLCTPILTGINTVREPVQVLYNILEKQTQLPEPLLAKRLSMLRLLHGITSQADEMKSTSEALHENILQAQQTGSIHKSDVLRQLSTFHGSLEKLKRLLWAVFGEELNRVGKGLSPHNQATVQPVVSTNGGIVVLRDDLSPGSVPNTLYLRQPIPMKLSMKETLVNIFAKHATSLPDEPNDFFKDLIKRADIPDQWKMQMSGVWKKNPLYSSRFLIDWCLSKGTNPHNPHPQFTVLGNILEILLQEEVGNDDAIVFAGLLVIYKHCLNQQLRENLAIRYQIPTLMEPQGGLIDTTLNKVWQGPPPADDLELQNFLKPDPQLIDIGFLIRAVNRAASVCRVELPHKGRQGTGFLIADNLLLTNYHIFEEDDDESLEENIHEAEFRFGYITLSQEQENKGQLFKARTTGALVEKSPTHKLDYLLLQMEDKIRDAQGISCAPYSLQTVDKSTCIHILQHPEGETMKIAISSNGITGVHPGGLVQYVTKTASGSSGAPCFNDNWEVVALHHAELSRSFGSIREGILLKAIYEQIEKHLSNRVRR